jgi:uncharacterized protein (TIGR01777 family)
MRVLITGGTGFIGSAMSAALAAKGAYVTILSRHPRPGNARSRCIESLDQIENSEHFDAIINLAGASLAAHRWTTRYKHEIVSSRMMVTRQLLELIGRLEQPPGALLSASAIGYYGHHGDEVLTEDGAINPGFAQQLCRDWETLALGAREYGIRVCLLRFGVVLDHDGGALVEMEKSFRLGVASWIGSGRQWLSWVHRDDVVRSMLFLMERNEACGAFNITAPVPVTGRDFCNALSAHHRTFVRAGVPAPVIRLLVGEMAEELLLNGQRVVPQRLQSLGFEWRYGAIDRALDAIVAARDMRESE